MERTDGINEARDARGLSGRGEDSMNHSIGVLPGTSYSRALPRSSILRSETSVCVSRETMRRGIYNGDVAYEHGVGDLTRSDAAVEDDHARLPRAACARMC